MRRRGQRALLGLSLAAALMATAGAALALWRPLLSAWYLERLESGEEAVRRAAARRLAEIGQPSAIAAVLRKGAGGRDEWLLEEVASAGGGTVPALVACLDEEDPSIRWGALWVLYRLEPPPAEALPAISRSLEDPDPTVRHWAVLAAGRQGEPAVPSLIRALCHEDGNVCNGAATQLQEILAGHAPPAVLAGLLRNETQAVRKAAARVVSDIVEEPGRAASILTQAVRDEPNLREWAALILVWTPGGIPAALGLLAEEELEEVVGSAMDACLQGVRPGDLVITLGAGARMVKGFGSFVLSPEDPEAWLEAVSPEVVPGLVAALRNRSDRVREVGVRALERLGPSAREALPALLEALGDPERKLELEAARALLALGPEAMAPLKRLLREGSPQVRSALVQAAGEAGSRARALAPDLLALLSDPSLARDALQALGEVGGAETEEELVVLSRLLEDDAGGLQSFAAATLARLGRRSVPILRHALRSGSRSARTAVLHALRAQPPLAVELLPEVLEALEDPSTRGPAMGALPAAGEAAREAVPRLAGFLEDPSAALRIDAARVLGRFGAHAAPAAPALIRALDDPNPGVRAAAAASLGEIGPAAPEALPALRQALEGAAPAFQEALEEAIRRIETAAPTPQAPWPPRPAGSSAGPSWRPSPAGRGKRGSPQPGYLSDITKGAPRDSDGRRLVPTQ